MRANEMIYCHMIMHGMELIGVDDTKNSKLISILEKVSSIKKLKKYASL